MHLSPIERVICRFYSRAKSEHSPIPLIYIPGAKNGRNKHNHPIQHRYWR